MLYIYSSSKLNLLYNVEMTNIGNKNARLFFFWPVIFFMRYNYIKRICIYEGE